MPRAIFHLNIEANSTATDEQLRHATSAIESALSVFDRLARPPFLAIATPPDSTHPSLTGYLIYDTHLDDFVSREVYFAAPQPNRTVAIVHRYPCYFVGGERIAR